MVRNFSKRSKKLLFFLTIFLFTGIFIVLHSSSKEETPELPILPILDATLPDLGQLNYVAEPSKSCKLRSLKLLAFVHSSPTHIPHRTAIRNTWGSAKYSDIKTVFIIGSSKNDKIWRRVQQEAKENGDIVLLQMVDSYRNLTLKHLSGMKWVLANCPRVPYILKADDDVFVDTKRLLSILDLFLGENSASKDSLVCHVIPEGSSPKRSGKWMVTQEEYLYGNYPEYCSGLAYFTRMSTMNKIYDIASSGGVPYLRIDDVFVTGLAATLAGVKRQDLGVRFANTEEPVIKWMLGKSMRPCPWMIAEISPYYWPKEAFKLWNKTVLSWQKIFVKKST